MKISICTIGILLISGYHMFSCNSEVSSDNEKTQEEKVTLTQEGDTLSKVIYHTSGYRLDSTYISYFSSGRKKSILKYYNGSSTSYQTFFYDTTILTYYSDGVDTFGYKGQPYAKREFIDNDGSNYYSLKSDEIGKEFDVQGSPILDIIKDENSESIQFSVFVFDYFHPLEWLEVQLLDSNQEPIKNEISVKFIEKYNMYKFSIEKTSYKDFSINLRLVFIDLFSDFSTSLDTIIQ